MALGTLSLVKEGDTPKKLSLGLVKDSLFTAELDWDTEHDVDVHAFLMTGGKVTDMENVLSTYNCKKTNKSGVLEANANGSFSTPDRALTHSGDVLTGKSTTVDEYITIDGGKVKAGIDEIPIFVTIHPPQKKIKFSEVNYCGIRIKDAQGQVLGEYRISDQFGAFLGVQIGSFLLGPSGWEFAEVAKGFNGDLNVILGELS